MTKCYECGSKESELIECGMCDKLICTDNENCTETLYEENGEPYKVCESCINKMIKKDCGKCLNEECPFDNMYSFMYDCEEYVDIKEE